MRFAVAKLFVLATTAAVAAEPVYPPLTALAEHSEWLTGHMDMFCKAGPAAQALRVDVLRSLDTLREDWREAAALAPKHPETAVFADWANPDADSRRLKLAVDQAGITRENPRALGKWPADMRGFPALTYLISNPKSDWLRQDGQLFQRHCDYAFAITVQLQLAAKALVESTVP